MANSKQALHNALRAKYVEVLTRALADMGEEVLQTASNEFAFPVCDTDGNDEFIVVKVQVPNGDRDGTPYDGYACARDYAESVAAKAKAAEEKAVAKAAKIARDEKARAEKAAAKAAHEAELAAAK